MSLSLEASLLISLCIQSVLFGLYLTSLYSVAKVFHDSPNPSRPLIVATTVMAALAFSEIGFSMHHILDAFVNYHGPGGPLGKLLQISDPVNLVKTINYCVQTLIGDALLIYRCWIVYQRRWYVAAVPILLWLGECACAGAVIYLTGTLKTNVTLAAKIFVPFFDAGLTITLVQNLLCTGLISWKIWSAFRQSSSTKHRVLRRALRSIIESGALYSVSLIVFLVTYLAGSTASYIAAEALVMIVPTVLNLILIRVQQGATEETAVENITSVQLYTRDIPTTIRFQDVSIGELKSRADIPDRRVVTQTRSIQV